MGGTISMTRGDMDIREQRSTWEFFMGLTKWGSLFVAVLVLFLTLWFCADAGFFGALVASVIATAAGVALLRKRDHA
jgi:energy-converting hydrogenase Eha subunit B